MKNKRRQSQDDGKCQHDLYEQPNCQVSNRGVGALDVRLKFQKKSNKQAIVGEKGSLSGVQIRTNVSNITIWYIRKPCHLEKWSDQDCGFTESWLDHGGHR
ncbi:unnamed protein product [Lactuca virosa]|uniref:Uncharacterized protein n=1 Tax=Lactuca virosa TaxID=75947 RepID=A0AAU9N2Y4_9ASTR|nr:unnamed protein product [Lactuca virosa]